MTTEKVIKYRKKFPLAVYLILIASTITTNLQADTGNIIPIEAVIIPVQLVIAVIFTSTIILYVIFEICRPWFDKRKHPTKSRLFLMAFITVAVTALLTYTADEELHLMNNPVFSLIIFVISISTGLFLGYITLPKKKIT